jgi:hypothetical protein
MWITTVTVRKELNKNSKTLRNEKVAPEENQKNKESAIYSEASSL